MNPFTKIISILALSALLLHCGGNPAPVANSPEPTNDKKQSVPPLSNTAQIDTFVQEVLKERQAAGISIAIAKQGQPLWVKGYGSTDLEHGIKTKPESIFRIGSITKQFTAVAILQLIESDKLALDAPITKYLPSYPKRSKAITLRHLLGHTSGIKNYTDDREWAKENMLDKSVNEMIALFKDLPLEFKPGTSFSYSNSGYFLLGAIIEKISGQSYANYLNEHIFIPAKLTKTSYCSEQSILHNRAQGYQRKGKSFQNDAPLSMTQPYAAGAICSTASDLTKWRKALTDGTLLTAASLQMMQQSNTLTNGEDTGYGLGLFISSMAKHPMISHGGAINGFSSQISSYPDNGLTIVVLANTEGANVGSLEQKIARLLLNIAPLTLKTIALPRQDAAVYVGTYALKGLGEMKIRLEGDTLKGQLNDQPNLPLLYQGQHTFVPDLSKAGAPIDPAIRFIFSVNNKQAVKMTLRQRGIELHFKRKD